MSGGLVTFGETMGLGLISLTSILLGFERIVLL